MRKKSVRKAYEAFMSEINQIDEFRDETEILSDQKLSWAYDYAIIRLYRAFEDFILSCLISAINNDTVQFSDSVNVKFPKHLTEEVCEYIIVGDGYFDFKGRSGLISTVKGYVADDHYLLRAVKNQKYKDALEQLSALRNFAAHESKPSKRRALQAIGKAKMRSSGAWLKNKKQGRFNRIRDKLSQFAQEVANAAPY